MRHLPHVFLGFQSVFIAQQRVACGSERSGEGMATYLAGKATQWGWWSKDTENNALQTWDSAQQYTATAVKWGFIPAVVLVAAVREEVPLHAFVWPLPDMP